MSVTNEEIDKFNAETKALMDAGPEHGLSFEAGIERICRFIEPLGPEQVLHWIRSIVAAYGPQTSDFSSEQRKTLQRINVALIKTPEYTAALDRYHAWKSEQRTPENAIKKADALVKRICQGAPYEEMAREACMYRDGLVSEDHQDCANAFVNAFRANKSAVVEHHIDVWRRIAERLEK